MAHAILLKKKKKKVHPISLGERIQGECKERKDKKHMVAGEFIQILKHALFKNYFSLLSPFEKKSHALQTPLLQKSKSFLPDFVLQKS